MASTVVARPRVTEILRAAGLCGDFRFVPQSALDRGTALHAAAEYLDQGDLDRESVDLQVAPYLAGYEKWLAEMRPEILAVEEEVVHAAYGYVGHYDRRVVMGGTEWIVDIKSGLGCARWHSLQTQLYAMTFSRPLRRACLHVAAGRYKLVEHAGRNDRSTCLAVLALHAWKQADA